MARNAEEKWIQLESFLEGQKDPPTKKENSWNSMLWGKKVFGIIICLKFNQIQREIYKQKKLHSFYLVVFKKFFKILIFFEIKIIFDIKRIFCFYIFNPKVSF